MLALSLRYPTILDGESLGDLCYRLRDRFFSLVPIHVRFSFPIPQ